MSKGLRIRGLGPSLIFSEILFGLRLPVPEVITSEPPSLLCVRHQLPLLGSQTCLESGAASRGTWAVVALPVEQPPSFRGELSVTAGDVEAISERGPVGWGGCDLNPLLWTRPSWLFAPPATS
ncbi:Zinc Finger Mym-Type Protein 6 [Manis pentadactyla]|nr:Zinc Finger Mym-Type Protein 6 [Manis pentadactyla]